MKHLSSNTYHASPLIYHLSFIISHLASIIYHRAPISQHPSSLFICNKGPTKTPRVVCKLSCARSLFGSGPGGITPTHWYHTNCSGIGMPENPDIWGSISSAISGPRSIPRGGGASWSRPISGICRAAPRRNAGSFLAMRSSSGTVSAMRSHS